jgi:hypothetical protein
VPSPEERPSPYRDGLGAVLAAYRTRLARVRVAARPLDVRARADLPRKTARRLAALEGQLAAEPADASALSEAEAALGEYEALVEESVWLAAELGQLHARWRARLAKLWVLPVAAAAIWAIVVFASDAAQKRRHEQASRECRGSAACRDGGRCDVTRRDDGSFLCVATSERDCDASTRCAGEGACTLKLGACVVGSDGDCRRSSACVEHGRCVGRYSALVQAERCVISDEGCRASRACSQYGRCGAGADPCVLEDEGRCLARGDACVVTSAEDCARSERCASEGVCFRRGNACEPCASTDACYQEGRCTLEGGRCVAASDHDCHGTAACCKECRCTAEAGACVVGAKQPPRGGGSKACRACPP